MVRCSSLMDMGINRNPLKVLKIIQEFHLNMCTVVYNVLYICKRKIYYIILFVSTTVSKGNLHNIINEKQMTAVA